MEQRPRVYILRGGPSEQYDLSLKTGHAVFDALRESEHFIPKDIVISQGGEWLVDGIVKRPEQALQGADVVFNALHGTFGEDGQIQRMLDAYGLPYTGSKQYASRVGSNKTLTKDLFRQAGIKTPRGARIKRVQEPSLYTIVQEIMSDLGSPLIIKPNNSGFSMGVTLAHNTEETVAAATALLQQHDDIIIEEFVAGREATSGILERFRNSSHYDLPVVEISPSTDRFFSASAKRQNRHGHNVPGRFSNYDKRRIAETARMAHQTIGAAQYSRSDFVVTPDDIYCLEINTLPDLAADSLFSQALESVGARYQDLIIHLLTDSLRR